MKIDFNKTINDLDGKPVELAAAVMRDGVEIKPAEYMTLRYVACNALMSHFPDEHNLPGEKKAERLALALLANGDTKIQAHKRPAVDLKPEQVAEIKQVIGKLYGPLPVGRAYELLNG